MSMIGPFIAFHMTVTVLLMASYWPLLGNGINNSKVINPPPPIKN